jgi:hypothetical protein
MLLLPLHVATGSFTAGDSSVSAVRVARIAAVML